MTRADRRVAAVLVAVVLLAALAAFMRWRADREQPQLTAVTRATGLPLTPEQRSVDFTHADLHFAIHPDRKAIEGRSLLTFTVRRPIERIQFDLDRNLPIESLSVNGQKLDAERWSNPEGRATVELPRAFAAGERLRLAIRYGGRPHVAKRAPWDGGFVWSKTPQGEPWIATAVQGDGCDLFWPCFDHSLVEIGSVDLHIDVPAGLVAPANGRLMGVTRGADGRRTFHWRARSPNNYAIALNIAPYREIRATYRSRYGNAVPLHYWHLPGKEAQARALFAEFAPTLDAFERLVGPYPFPGEKVGAVETPHLGMEHQTINAYGNAYKPAALGFDWLFNHEFAHEWFGNQLTNRDWDDMWLHEGFATYLQPLYARERGGAIPYAAELWRIRALILNRLPMVSGRSRPSHLVYDPATGPGTDIYYKGAWVLHALRVMIGDEAFFRAVRRFVYGRPDPAPGNFSPRFGTTDEFVAIAGQEAGRDLRWFFDAYLRHAQLPRLVARRDRDRLLLEWRAGGKQPFATPVEVAIDGGVQTVPMTAGRGAVALPRPGSSWTLDPAGKLLRQDDAIDRFRDWTASQASATKD